MGTDSRQIVFQKLLGLESLEECFYQNCGNLDVPVNTNIRLNGARKLLGRMQKLAADPAKVVKAVEHAQTAKRPKRRYLLDSPSRLQKALVAITPTPLTDAVLAAATTSRG